MDMPRIATKKVAFGLSLLISMVLIILLFSNYLYRPVILSQPVETQPDLAAIERGNYLLAIAGCFGCHTSRKENAVPFAGGDAIESPFGNLYAPNITSDPVQGLGSWTLADFSNAVRNGISPNHQPYYPAFPYTAFRGLTDQDVQDLWVALGAIPASTQISAPHQLVWPMSLRPMVHLWRLLFFRYDPLPTSSPDSGMERGAYLVNHVIHCGECHTPRNMLGALKPKRFLAGGVVGNPDYDVPDIRSSALKSRGWSEDDLTILLSYGMTREGDLVGSYMSVVTDEATSRLSDSDLNAVVNYILH